MNMGDEMGSAPEINNSAPLAGSLHEVSVSSSFTEVIV